MSAPRKAIVTTVLLLLVVVVAVFFLARNRFTADAPSTAASQRGVGGSQDGGTRPTHGEPNDEAREASPHPSRPRPESKRTFETLNHNPIRFYGRAVDQFGNPVAGAEVRGSVLYNTGGKSGRKLATTTTDAAGYFQFSGLEGQSLGLDIAKEGYEFATGSAFFWYSYFEADHKRHQPDPRNPVVLTLWKKQGPASLVRYEKSWRFPANAGPVRIDLESGEISGPSADLIVTVSRSPLGMPYGARGFAWRATIEAVEGGLVRADRSDYYNLAPVAGYVPRLDFSQEAQSVLAAQEQQAKWTWQEGVADTFFVTSRAGKNYARVSLRIRPNVDRQEGDNEALIAVNVWLNPNRSRNLECDPSKAIVPKS
jgi:hypothetical protein